MQVCTAPTPENGTGTGNFVMRLLLLQLLPSLVLLLLRDVLHDQTVQFPRTNGRHSVFPLGTHHYENKGGRYSVSPLGTHNYEHRMEGTA